MKPLDFFFDTYDRLRQRLSFSSEGSHHTSSILARTVPVALLFLVGLSVFLMFIWGSEPDRFDPIQHATQLTGKRK